MSWIPQIAIMLTGVTAIALTQSADPNTRRYACIFGLVGQPFWFWSAISAQQWGIVAMCVLYTLAWAKGIKTHWIGIKEKANGAAEIRVLPAPLGGGRVETGPVQFGGDWPGVFIRGDNAGSLASLLAHPASQDMAIAKLRRLLTSAIVGLAAEAFKEWPDGDD